MNTSIKSINIDENHLKILDSQNIVPYPEMGAKPNLIINLK